jgi:F0F1-type ATP synthase assembly protein I
VVVFAAVVPVDNPPSEKPDQKRSGEAGDWTRALREAAPYLGIGSSLAFTLLACLGIGYWLDSKLGTKPAGFLLGGVFGLFAAGYSFYKTTKRMGRNR